MTAYQTIETTSLTNEADSNLPKEESTSHHKWLAVVASALIMGGGTMVVSSLSSLNVNLVMSSEMSLNKGSLVESVVSPYGCDTFFQKESDDSQVICVGDQGTPTSCCWRYGDCDDHFCWNGPHSMAGPPAWTACKYPGW
eukprot:CAMPEP_0170966888 /NCGR_PEP_ID=MMETSP0735-20130129/42141_1 /TAXON_ID=186038 /ORGANISM="Fragilariopsis kerguelensis, Strain L26-C5" /LENGTH=139 /DNA_ID=CAMNT_0011385233 /DNA_START=53 /DNA_END=469 /DNA_ORIENTATION=-